jgi:hypothetical protein
MDRACSNNGEKRNAYKMLLGRPEWKRLLGIPWRSWVDTIKMNLWENWLGGMDCIDLAQDRNQWMALENTMMNHRVS